VQDRCRASSAPRSLRQSAARPAHPSRRLSARVPAGQSRRLSWCVCNEPLWWDQSKPQGAHDAKGPFILVRCPRDDDEEPHTIALAFQAATGDTRCFHPLRAPCGSIAVLRLCGLVQRRAKFAWVIHCLKNLLDSFGGLKSNQREILHGASRRAGAHVQGARSCVRQCRTRCKCAPTTERRTFVLSPRGRRWPTYSFSARARVHQFQRVWELSGFCSKAFHASLFQCAARPVVKCIRGSPRTHG